MKLKITLALLIAIFTAPAPARAALSDLEGIGGNIVYAAVQACRASAALVGCVGYGFGVAAGHNNHIPGSCHYVNKAVDVTHPKSRCLSTMAACLTLDPAVLICYRSWGVGKILNMADKSKCTPSNHQTHIHVQPMLGCWGGGSDD